MFRVFFFFEQKISSLSHSTIILAHMYAKTWKSLHLVLHISQFVFPMWNSSKHRLHINFLEQTSLIKWKLGLQHLEHLLFFNGICFSLVKISFTMRNKSKLWLAAFLFCKINFSSFILSCTKLFMKFHVILFLFLHPYASVIEWNTISVESQNYLIPKGNFFFIPQTEKNTKKKKREFPSQTLSWGKKKTNFN
jgi:hypothetical protein